VLHGEDPRAEDSPSQHYECSFARPTIPVAEAPHIFRQNAVAVSQ